MMKTRKSSNLKVNVRYLPKRLSSKDKQRQIQMLQKSRRLYKKGQYYTRKKVASFPEKRSPFLSKAEKIYGVSKIGATPELAKSSGCSQKSLREIIRKGEGAYYSSGSRPNQTAQSWGVARLASALTSGKAAVVDYSILEKGCHPKTSKALRLAKQAVKKYGRTLRRAPKVTVK